MADLVITPANVVAGSNASTDSGTAGEALVAGKAVYKSPTTNKWLLADSNHADAVARKAIAITLNAAAANQPVDVQKGGDITLGAVLTAGTAYYLSDTAGGFCPVADVGTG